MKILLTGASGNLGSAISHQPGLEIVPVGRNDWATLDRHLDSGVNAVVHAASDLTTSVSTQPVAVLDSNVMSTARLLEGMRRHRINRLVFVSSCAVYGNSVDSREETPCAPISINGIAKLLSERMIEQFCDAQDIAFTTLRVFNMFGGNDHFSMIHRLLDAAAHDKPFILNNEGIAQRDWIHVDDVAAVVADVLIKNPEFRYLNVGSGVAVRVADIVDLVRQRVPELQLERRAIAEAEYSRANLTRLRTVTDREFVSVLTYLENLLEHGRQLP